LIGTSSSNIPSLSVTAEADESATSIFTSARGFPSLSKTRPLRVPGEEGRRMPASKSQIQTEKNPLLTLSPFRQKPGRWYQYKSYNVVIGRNIYRKIELTIIAYFRGNVHFGGMRSGGSSSGRASVLSPAPACPGTGASFTGSIPGPGFRMETDRPSSTRRDSHLFSLCHRPAHRCRWASRSCPG